MAHFYGTVQGQRGMVSRLGSKPSGLTATANGWNLGASCSMEHYTDSGGDSFDRLDVQITAGSAQDSRHFGGFTCRREGDSVRIHPDATFLANMPPKTIGVRLRRLRDPDLINAVAELLLTNDVWVRHLRAKLWVEGKAYEPA